MTTIPAPSPTRRRMADVPAAPPSPPLSAAPLPPAADRVHDLELEVAQMRTAMASRAVIEQAKGILMLLTGCTEQVAFDVLTHISSTTHRKVRELAVAITDSACGRSALPADVQDAIRDVCPPRR
ncbi:ANTAR domain-containing protein [Blastococcus sp. URHD0036]|uniref:ANTAR domain-containing protein n=1 Tax=Blastococcus sp. URHD0036 TaxID=1380356 RepID=UPI0012DCFA0F|nr:ANTAR domain-containing protein [Blastococcus sp. URHD0036]